MRILNIKWRAAGIGAGLVIMGGIMDPFGARAQATSEWPILVGSLSLVLSQERSQTNTGAGWNADWTEINAGTSAPSPAVTIATQVRDSMPPAGVAAPDSDSFAPVIVPEPSTAGLALAGLLVGGLFGGIRCLRGGRKR